MNPWQWFQSRRRRLIVDLRLARAWWAKRERESAALVARLERKLGRLPRARVVKR